MINWFSNTVLLVWTLKMREAWLPLSRIRLVSAEPSMVKFLLSKISPEIEQNPVGERRAVYGQILVEQNLACGQHDGLAGETRRKRDGVAGRGGGDGVAQRACAGIGVVRHGQGCGVGAQAEHQAKCESEERGQR